MTEFLFKILKVNLLKKESRDLTSEFSVLEKGNKKVTRLYCYHSARK